MKNDIKLCVANTTDLFGLELKFVGRGDYGMKIFEFVEAKINTKIDLPILLQEIEIDGAKYLVSVNTCHIIRLCENTDTQVLPVKNSNDRFNYERISLNVTSDSLKSVDSLSINDKLKVIESTNEPKKLQYALDLLQEKTKQQFIESCRGFDKYCDIIFEMDKKNNLVDQCFEDIINKIKTK